MASYLNGKRISGIRDFPAYTWDEYHALPVAQRPKVWKCTDRDYTEIPVTPVTFTLQTDSISMITLPSKPGYRLSSFFTERTVYVERYCINENDPSMAHVKVSDYGGSGLAQNTNVNVVAYYHKI